jgi:hypothetical protein
MLATWPSQAAAAGVLLTTTVGCGRTPLHPTADARGATDGAAESARRDSPADVGLPTDDADASAATDAPPASPWLELCRKRLAGGVFQRLADTQRADLAAFDGAGNLLPWTGQFGEPPVFTQPMAMLGDKLLLLAGLRSAGVFPTRLMALDRDGRPTPLDLDFNGDIRALQVHDGVVYAGGSFTFIDGHYASGFAKLAR